MPRSFADRRAGADGADALQPADRPKTPRRAFAVQELFSRVAAQPFRVERAQRFRNEPSVFTDQFPVEMNGPPTVIGALNIDHVPMDLRAVAVVGFLVRLAR